MPTPPDHFPLWTDMTGLTSTQIATSLGNQFTNFYTTYGMYPNQVVTVGSVVFFGAY